MAAAALSPGSWADFEDDEVEMVREVLAPGVLAWLPADTMLAAASVPGKVLEEWRHADFGVWIAWPHAVDAVHAEEMTAGQLRAILAARDGT